MGNAVTRFSQSRRLPYEADAMYDLVLDIARYPQFLPWCAASRIRRRETDGNAERIEADLVLAFGPIRERYTSQVLGERRAGLIRTASADGPFRRMESRWRFGKLPDGECQIDFSMEYQLRSRLLQRLAGGMFERAMARIVQAFEARAAALHARKP